jgi:hypothetical protein
LSGFSRDPKLQSTGFLFYRHEYGTVLSAAHLYDGRYIWAKVYSPDRLEDAARPCERVVYLEGAGDPDFRLPGFCPVAEDMVELGLRPGQPGNAEVRVIQAERC